MGSKVIGIRLKSHLVNKLEKIAEQSHQTASQLAKSAVIDWIEIHFSAQNLDMITIPKDFFRDFLNSKSDEELKEYSRKLAEKTAGFYEFLEQSHRNYIDIGNFFSIILKFLGNNGLMWFDHLEFESKKRPYYMKGLHNMGKNWSKFILYTSKYLLEEYFPFPIDLSESRITSGSINLIFQYPEKLENIEQT